MIGFIIATTMTIQAKQDSMNTKQGQEKNENHKIKKRIESNVLSSD